MLVATSICCRVHLLVNSGEVHPEHLGMMGYWGEGKHLLLDTHHLLVAVVQVRLQEKVVTATSLRSAAPQHHELKTMMKVLDPVLLPAAF